MALVNAYHGPVVNCRVNGVRTRAIAAMSSAVSLIERAYQLDRFCVFLKPFENRVVQSPFGDQKRVIGQFDAKVTITSVGRQVCRIPITLLVIDSLGPGPKIIFGFDFMSAAGANLNAFHSEVTFSPRMHSPSKSALPLYALYDCFIAPNAIEKIAFDWIDEIEDSRTRVHGSFESYEESRAIVVSDSVRGKAGLQFIELKNFGACEIPIHRGTLIGHCRILPPRIPCRIPRTRHFRN